MTAAILFLVAAVAVLFALTQPRRRTADIDWRHASDDAHLSFILNTSEQRGHSPARLIHKRPDNPPLRNEDRHG